MSPWRKWGLLLGVAPKDWGYILGWFAGAAVLAYNDLIVLGLLCAAVAGAGAQSAFGGRDWRDSNTPQAIRRRHSLEQKLKDEAVAADDTASPA